MTRPVVEMRGIRKGFGNRVALDGAELTLQRGEILGLVGDNGAGKSTLLKILSGVIRADEGEIRIDGVPVSIRSPRRSRGLGIEMVFQDLSLCERLTVWENMYLGRYESRGHRAIPFRVLDKGRMSRRSLDLLAGMGIVLRNADIPVQDLSGGERQAVAIGRCLLLEPKILLLDEPTASMAVWERERILELLRHLTRVGRSMIMVTHNLEELFKVAHRAVVLKEGRTVRQGGPLDDMAPEDLVRMMFLGKAQGNGTGKAPEGVS